MKKLTPKKKAITEELIGRFGTIVTRKQIISYVRELIGPDEDPNFSKVLPRWICNTKKFRVSRGVYNLQRVLDLEKTQGTVVQKTQTDTTNTRTTVSV